MTHAGTSSNRALFVDLSNLYTRLVNSGIAPAAELREYFLSWFDFSTLALFLVREKTDVWVFYSSTRLGPAKFKIDGTYLESLIERFDQQVGVGTQNVNIPNNQREPYVVDCESCGAKVEAQFKSEKGIDSALTVHLFDTLDSWDAAFILSGDADFVAAVRSLRRRGKIINGAGILSQASKALVRECFEYRDLTTFFMLDFAAHRLLGSNGFLTAGLDSFLKTEMNQTSARVIWRLEYLDSLPAFFTLKLESSLIDLGKLELSVGGLPVNQLPAEDSRSFELPISLLEIVRGRLLNFFLSKPKFSNYRELRQTLWVETYYLEFRWNATTSQYCLIGLSDGADDEGEVTS